MSLPVTIRREATQDLEEASEWYEGRRTGLGRTFKLRAAWTLDAIGRMPELYGVFRKQVRAAPIPRYRYVIYYCILKDRVEIVAVLHGHRGQETLKRRLAP